MVDPQQPQPGPEPLATSSERRRPLNSVSTRIIFFVFLSTFLTALVVSWISIQTIHSHLRREILQRFPAMLERRAGPVDAWLRESLVEIEALETRWDLGGRLATAAARGRQLGPEEQRLLEEALPAQPRLSGLALLGPGGEEIALAGPIRHTRLRSIAPDPTNRASHVAVIRDERHPGAAVVLPLFSPRARNGQPVGHLIGLLRLEQLGREMTLDPHEGPGRMLLADRSGTLLATSGEPPREATARVPVARLAATPGSLEEYTSSDGQHVIGSSQPLTSVDWLLVVEAPFEEAFAPVLAVVSRIFLSDLVIILGFSFLAYKITAAIMQPIEALSDGALRIAQGRLDHEIPAPRSNDEIGLLTRTFNDMMRKLRSSQHEIEEDKKRLTEQNEELQRANEVLAQLSITDGLTKLHNHRYFQDHLTREIKRLSRTGESLSVILIDLDDFKRLNDRHGHAAGDAVLLHIAGLMNDSVRESDLLARYGGEEFVILATGTDRAGAVNLAEKIRLAVEESPLIVDDSMRPVRVTISCGVAQYSGDRRRFFHAADRALYRAKAEGKNCVIASDADD